MRSKRIVITGVGVISSIGIGKDEFWNALQNGKSGIKPITLFDTKNYKVHLAGEASGFEPKKLFTKRELINYDRATALILATAKQAIEDARLIKNDDLLRDAGVCVGTTFGSLQSLSEFDKESVIKGPQLVNPSRFPNSVANLPSSQVSISFNIKGSNTTISTGMCAGLDAIDYALKAIRRHGRKIVLTGALEEMCEQTFIGFYLLKILSGLNGTTPVSCPFDQRRNGVILGEGSSVLMLEDLESAQKRGVKIYAEILSVASNFDPYRVHKYNPKGTGMIHCMRLAMERAGLKPKDIDYVCANANSTMQADLAEAKAIKEVFDSYAKTVPVSAIKSMTGETYSAAGGLATVASIGCMENDFVPPTVNFTKTDMPFNLRVVANKSERKKVRTVMVNAFGQNGANTTLILRKYSK